MIRRLSYTTFETESTVFAVEYTPRCGHLVKVANRTAGWAGLYRWDEALVLLARCQGQPPTELSTSADVAQALQALIECKL